MEIGTLFYVDKKRLIPTSYLQIKQMKNSLREEVLCGRCKSSPYSPSTYISVALQSPFVFITLHASTQIH